MAGDHEESNRSDSRRDSVESQKSVDKVASSKTSADVKASGSEKDDDWGYEPKKAGMTIEAKMGMCIVVILISAFGFLVYRRFDDRQRSLLQANLQAAEKALPGSTGDEFVGQYAEFQKPDGLANSEFVASVTEPALGSETESSHGAVDVTFGSTFALQDERPTETPVMAAAEAEVAGVQPSGPFAGSPFDDSPFGALDEPAESLPAANPLEASDTVALAFADSAAQAKPDGQQKSPFTVYLEETRAEEAAMQQNSTIDENTTGSSFANFNDANSAAGAAIPVANGSQQLAELQQVAESQQVVESQPPAFDGFPAGFEPELEQPLNPAAEQPVKPETTLSGGGFEGFPQEQFDSFTDPSTGSRTNVAGSAVSDHPPQEFAGFDAPAETVDTKPSGLEEVDWSPAESFHVDSIAQAMQPETQLAQEQAPDLVPFDDSPFAAAPFQGADHAQQVPPSDALQQVAENQPAPFPAGFDQPFDPSVASHSRPDTLSSVSTDVSRPSLNPYPNPESDLNQSVEIGSSRRPLIDPAGVMDPVDHGSNLPSFPEEDTSIQVAQADFPRTSQPWQINDGSSLPKPDETSLVSQTNSAKPSSQPAQSFDHGFAGSFGGAGEVPEFGSNSSSASTLTAVDQVQRPRLPKLSEPVVTANSSHSSSNSGAVQQVSATRDPDGIYTVKPDDTYWTISKHAYGTARFFSSLALYNQKRIQDPRNLRPGMKVVIPDYKVLVERYPELHQDFIPKKTLPSGYFLKPNGMPAYRIGANETLSEISQKHLGRASRWIQIYRMNQNVLKNPNRLKLGTVIDLPDDATNVHLVP